MGPIETAIREKLRKELLPQRFELENESEKHGFSRGPEGQFKILVVSEAFERLRTLERHQKIYSLLKEELAGGVHALAIKALTPSEYANLGGDFDTPECRHSIRH